MSRRVLLSIVLGIAVTFILFGLALAAANAGDESLAQVLFWQNSLLQSLAPLGNIGTPEHPILEGTPLNFLAFILSFPLGFFLYGSVSYGVLGFAVRRA